MNLSDLKFLSPRVQKKIISAFLLMLSWMLPLKLRAADPTIVDVRRNIQLSDTDPIFKDYYINAGAAAGLKTSQVVKVIRKVPMRDATGAQAFGELDIAVGQVKIIFVQGNMAVAREFELFSREELPMLEQVGIMIGDKIDLEGSFVDIKKKSAKRTKREDTPPPEKDASASSSTAVISVVNASEN